MAQYYDDFESYPVGGGPPPILVSEWINQSENIGTSSALANMGDKAFRVAGVNSYQPTAYRYTAATGSDTDEAYCEFFSSNLSSQLVTLILRGSAGASLERTGYVARLSGRASTIPTAVVRYDNNAVSTLKSSNTDFTVSTPMKALFSATTEGVNVRLKLWVWNYADPRPVTPNIDVLDTTPLPIGWLGVGGNSQNSFHTVNIGAVGFGTNGDAANPNSDAGYLFWAYYPSNQADPGAGAIITGTVPNGVHGNDPAPEGSIDPFTGAAITGLTPSASYKLASVWYNGTDNSNVVISDAFVATAAGTAPVLSLATATGITGNSIVPQITVTFS